MKNFQSFLDEKVELYNQPDFIANDPISIPHLFTKKQDIEIIGFWVSMLSWGQRKTIINKSKELLELLDNSPYDFVLNHQESDLKHFLSFRHRTFNATDTLYFIHFFNWFYKQYDSLEKGFSQFMSSEDETVEKGIAGFHNLFFSLPDYPERTRKHIATPLRNSACKRINMFLRWVVRTDDCGVDFGLWNEIKPSQLVCPCDVHVGRVANKLNLIQTDKMNWKTAIELTNKLKEFDAEDPVKYDFALFGLGVEKYFD
ncbi:MAG: TIGR02757 family protein [Cyclobacteriaceae bacterium]